ncbi:VOC family protein [Polyangium mundeleinium]|uniref:VOC domain-containing protein n=1 Tax=Polyangium mundeleinium TaxID=2995306 RepID=A0ABT5EG43_9BACT|nr:VOC family protein [Polyangium mundeleinium]MDC0740780.1 hypothetical protein [Polyangium mundeleinium]
MVVDLSLLVIRTSDIDAAKRFYEALGLLWREERHEGGPRHDSCRVGATLLELYPAKEAPRGRMRLGFRVDDPARAAEAAIAAGGRWRRDAHPGAGIILQDPDGNDVELAVPSEHEALG